MDAYKQTDINIEIDNIIHFEYKNSQTSPTPWVL